MLPPRAFLFAVLAFAPLGGGPAASVEGRDAPEPGRLAALAAWSAAAGNQAPDEAAGVAFGARGGCGLVPRFSEDVGFHGPITGEPEKDSVGFLLTGHEEGCPGAPIR